MVFGELNENNGIVDAENKSDVKKRLKKCKLELDDTEIHLLQKNEDYVPKFSQYIEDRQDIISKSMRLKARCKAHMPVDEKGTPLRPYINSSESMNNVMLQAENDFLRYNNNGKKKNLSKLEFARHVFEEIYEREMRELKLVLCGLSEEYRLTRLQNTFNCPSIPGSIGANTREKTTSLSSIPCQLTMLYKVKLSG